MSAASGLPCRVLLVAPQPFYQDRGTPIAVRHVLTALSQRGDQVDVLTLPIGTPVDLPGVRYLRVRNPLGFRNVPIGFSWRKVWFDLWLIAALIRQLRRQRYDCIHAVEEAAWFAAVIGRWFRTPVIYDMQSSIVEQLSLRPGLRNWLSRAMLAAWERWVIAHTDQAACSIGLAARVRKAVPSARVVEWCYPGHISPSNPHAVRRLRQDLDLEDDRQVILYTGNFEEYQGLGALIKGMPTVLSRLPRAVLVLVGGEGEGVAAIERRLAARVPPGTYRLLTRQPRELLANFLAMADVVVSPRIVQSSNVPLKVFDYLAAGCAIVATDTPSHRQLLNEQIAVFAAPNAAGLAEAILSVLESPHQAAALRDASHTHTRQQLGWQAFAAMVSTLYAPYRRRQDAAADGPIERISVIIPAHNAESMIGRVVRRALEECPKELDLEVLVVDDHSTDATVREALDAGARVVTLPEGYPRRNPAAARNRGAAAATGELLVFLDADCVPAPGWLTRLRAAHARGEVCVGGSLELPPELPASARWDYYCGWYAVHPGRSAGPVPNHPPCNVSVLRKVFLLTPGFTERQPIAYAHEELAWQGALLRAGYRVYFEPGAVVYHWNRRGLGNLLRRNYRWAYSTVESKATTGAARFSWLYRHPWLAILAGLVTAPIQAVYIIASWLRAGVIEPIVVFPVVLAARAAYAAGMVVGGFRWMGMQHGAGVEGRPRWE